MTNSQLDPSFGSGRSSGVLLHPTSLPGGDLGAEAYRFIDWLAAAGQRWWQVLPLGPPDRSGSPYAGLSAFAGNPGLLSRPDAKVSTTELEEFVGNQRYWIGGWTHVGGRGALEDQVRFEREWSRLRHHAAERGIRILGDIPFYVARGGVDHVEHPMFFKEDQSAGVPPDDWSSTGQLWSSPVYNWNAMALDGFHWWIERFRRLYELVDAVRVDHFRGFVAYWSIPNDSVSAEFGTWRRGPGFKLFDAVHRALGVTPLVAENLGLITPAVEHLRQCLGIPGTIVLQFQFSESLMNRPPRQVSGNNVIYTGTHDNDTSCGWWRHASEQERANVDRMLAAAGIIEAEPHWKLIRLALRHPADLCIIPAQDLLGLGSSARMNHPGRAKGNWRWQLSRGMLTVDLARRIKEETLASSR